MSKFSKIYFTWAVSLLFGTTAGFADVTNANVWESWQSYITSMGHEISANELVSGNVLTITDVKIEINFALGKQHKCQDTRNPIHRTRRWKCSHIHSRKINIRS